MDYGPHIEHMTVQDLDDVLDIETQSFEDPWPAEVFRAELRHAWSHCRVLRHRPRGPVVGYVVFWSVADEVHLLHVAVDPDKRGARLGSLLMAHLRAFAVERAARIITLEVRRSNRAALAMYERIGFRQVGVRRRYYKNNGEDAIVMRCDLTEGDAD